MFEESADPSRPSDSHVDDSALAFEKEFDGVRRQVVPAEETLYDPSRYWDLGGGGTD
jgi:hypothetical protein